MLVLSRKKGERIVINDNIQIEVVAVRGEIVRIGLTAPPNIPIHREEIYDRIQSERAAEQQIGCPAESLICGASA